MFVITGGAGFVGSNLVAEMEARGYTDLVVVDTLGEEDKWRNIGKRELRDFIRPSQFSSFLEENRHAIKAIFHMGSISSTTERDADSIIANNFNMSHLLWRWCGQNNVRFIYASAAATYGDGSAGFKDDASPEALAKLRPLNPYGWSKHLFDRRVIRVLQDKSEPVPPQWAGLKFFNIYGPNEYHKGDQTSVACKLFPHVEAGAAARLFKSSTPQYKDGEQLRDFIYVRDVVDVMIWLYEHPNVSGLFNLGTGQARSFNDLAAAVFKALGKPVKINYIDMPETLRDRYQSYTQADMTKLRSVGYDKPFTDLETGVADYVQNYLLKQDKYR